VIRSVMLKRIVGRTGNYYYLNALARAEHNPRITGIVRYHNLYAEDFRLTSIRQVHCCKFAWCSVITKRPKAFHTNSHRSVIMDGHWSGVYYDIMCLFSIVFYNSNGSIHSSNLQQHKCYLCVC